MVFTVNICSRELIKPSSPTPHHLRLLHLSSLDKLAPPIFVPLILYYKPSNTHDGNVNASSLRASLSQCLVHFYPLAGKSAGGSIDCNDQGVEFVETRVAGFRLQNLIESPEEEVLGELVPCRLMGTKSEIVQGALLAVQVNFFDCGGVALGVCFSHIVGDMATFATFLKTWAATSRSDGVNYGLIRPGMDLFPPSESAPAAPPYEFPARPDPVMRRLVFSDASIAALRRRRGNDATRIESVTALLSRCIARASRRDSNKERVFIVSHSVNIRPRTSPALPSDAIGNLSVVSYTTELSEDELNQQLESELRTAIKKIDSEFVREMPRTGWFNRAMEPLTAAMERHAAKKEVVHCAFSSWCNFGLYEVDFGCGRPEWLSPAPMPYENICVLLDGRDGDGMEAWVCLGDDVMNRFQQDDELISLFT